jgi:hypothetical protein
MSEIKRSIVDLAETPLPWSTDNIGIKRCPVNYNGVIDIVNHLFNLITDEIRCNLMEYRSDAISYTLDFHLAAIFHKDQFECEREYIDDLEVELLKSQVKTVVLRLLIIKEQFGYQHVNLEKNLFGFKTFILVGEVK